MMLEIWGKDIWGAGRIEATWKGSVGGSGLSDGGFAADEVHMSLVVLESLEWSYPRLYFYFVITTESE